MLPAVQVVEMGSLGNVQSALAVEVENMRARTAAQEDDYCETIAELQAQVKHWCLVASPGLSNHSIRTHSI